MSEHDTDCERVLTENGYVFIDCLCSLRKAKADAWDEGYMARWQDHRDVFGPRTKNPYRRGLAE